MFIPEIKSNNPFCVVENIYSLTGLDQYQKGFYEGFNHAKEHKCYAWLVKELINVDQLPSNPKEKELCNFFYKTYCLDGFCSGETSLFLDYLQKGGKLDTHEELKKFIDAMRIDQVFYHHLLQLPFLRTVDSKTTLEGKIELLRKFKELRDSLAKLGIENQYAEEGEALLKSLETKKEKRDTEIAHLKEKFPIFALVKTETFLSGSIPESYREAFQKAICSLGLEKEETLRGAISLPGHIMGFQRSAKEGFFLNDQLKLYHFPDENAFFEGMRSLVLNAPSVDNREDVAVEFEILPPLKKAEGARETAPSLFPIESKKFAPSSAVAVYRDTFKATAPPSRGDVRGEILWPGGKFKFAYNPIAKGSILLDTLNGQTDAYKDENSFFQAMRSFLHMYVCLQKKIDPASPEVFFKIHSID